MTSSGRSAEDARKALEPKELARIAFAADEALAHQSRAGVLGHWVLAAVLLGTTTLASDHPRAAALGGAWMLLVGLGRLIVTRAFVKLYPRRSELWTLLFRAGLTLSSFTWGAGGAALVLLAGEQKDAWLVLMCVAGVSAAGVTSLSPSRACLRLHVVWTLVPTFLAGFLAHGGGRVAVGFALIVVAFGGFLWVQGEHAHETFFKALVGTTLLERQTAELEAARVSGVEASRVKSEFLANMSHEIRTPMSAVIGYADLLLDPTLGDSERVTHLQTIRRNGEHLMELINDILDVSKIEAGKMTVESIRTSPSQVIVDVASLMRVRAAAKGLEFNVKYIGKIPATIASDPTRLKQIVMNFVGNAIKFTETGSVVVRVECWESRSPQPRFVVEVADTGIGMSQEQVGRLFQSFTQGDASTTRKFGGSGLGLLISKRLAELLGGSVAVESSIGAGSVFRLTVPTGSLEGVEMIDGLAEAGLQNARASSRRRVAVLPRPCRVLLAEDGPDNQALITTYLTQAGATVKVVSDGHQAVEAAIAALGAGAPYDLVLMDMQMPELDGYGATSKLRTMKYDRPIVALTAHAMAGDRARCESAGCDEYLTKPVDRSNLVAMVARFLGSAEAVPYLASTLEDDEDMKEIVHEFVRSLSDRSSAIVRAHQAGDAATLRRLAHQLRGAAGGYGFPSITESAAALERAIADESPAPSLLAHVEKLASLCHRARAA